jgi:hypothetical protein
VERVTLGVRPSEFILLELRSPSRRIFIGSHSLPPPLWSPNQSFNVLSSWVPTASGMVLQCSGWWRSGGDGRTGPMVTEKTCLTGPTSRRRPVRVRDMRSYPF